MSSPLIVNTTLSSTINPGPQGSSTRSRSGEMIEALVLLAIAVKVLIELAIIGSVIFAFISFGATNLLPWILAVLGLAVVSVLNIEDYDR
jgi:hypothetical protein